MGGHVPTVGRRRGPGIRASVQLALRRYTDSRSAAAAYVPAMHPIVICYDGSEYARRAITEAGGLYADGRPAVVLHVWTAPLPPDVAYAGFAPVVPDAAAYQAQQRATEAEAERVAEEGAQLARDAGFDAEPLVVKKRDDVAGTVATVASELGAAAVVAGSRGRNLVTGLLLGSVTLGLLHDAEQPVVVVPPRAGAVLHSG